MIDTRQDNTIESRLEATHGQSGGFLKGLVGGALIGTAAGVFFAPQIYATLRHVRREFADAAATASDAAANSYRETTTRVGDAVEDLQQKGRDVYGKALNVVVRGAEEVKERATEAQTELDRGAAPGHAARRKE